MFPSLSDVRRQDPLISAELQFIQLMFTVPCQQFHSYFPLFVSVHPVPRPSSDIPTSSKLTPHGWLLGVHKMVKIYHTKYERITKNEELQCTSFKLVNYSRKYKLRFAKVELPLGKRIEDCI